MYRCCVNAGLVLLEVTGTRAVALLVLPKDQPYVELTNSVLGTKNIFFFLNDSQETVRSSTDRAVKNCKITTLGGRN